ncbi:MAG: carbonic anhydrase [Candidatus Paceibacterota bacterium]
MRTTRIRYLSYLIDSFLSFLGLIKKYPALVIECMDPRLDKHWRKTLSFLRIDSNRCDKIHLAGSARFIAEALKKKKDCDFFEPGLKVSLGKHHIKKVYIFFHNGCGGYGIEYWADELFLQLKDSLLVGDSIESNWPEVEVFYVRQRLKGVGGYEGMKLTMLTKEEACKELNGLKAFVSEELKS